jgi:surface carbohydrate biosynthesis protein
MSENRRIFGRSVAWGDTMWLKILMNTRLRWNPPPSANLCVLHGENLVTFGPAVIGDRPHLVLTVPPDSLWIGPSMLWRMLRLLPRLDLRFILWGGRSTLTRRAFGRLLRLYYLALLHEIEPRAVLTFIDDSVLFQWLCRFYPKATFIAVQNGIRSSADLTKFTSALCDPAPQQIHLPIYFCHGQRDVDQMRRHGAQVAEYVPVGSALAGAYHPSHTQSVRHRLCLVSLWHASMEFEGAYPDLWRGISQLDSYLERYSVETNTSVTIALRSADPREAAYFRRVFGPEVLLIPRVPGQSIYAVMAESDLIVSVSSTALMEAFGTGAKVCFVNLTGLSEHSMVEPGPWLIEDDDFSVFVSRLNYLLAMPIEQWRQETRDYSRYCMAGQDEPAHRVIQARIDAALFSGENYNKNISDRQNP